MRRFFTSLLIISVIAVSVVSLSNAFFSDSETSTDNILQAGAIDLIIGNTSYYNGEFQSETTFDELTNQLFLNFTDLKPSDWGEDTIDITVETNDSWMCANIDITANDDNGNTEPELLVDDPDGESLFDGELAQNVEFIFWIDDGDNVLEDNEALPENIIAQGLASEILNGASWAIADSTTNIFEGSGPLIGGQTYFIGKAWCFGDLEAAPLAQDGENNLVTPGNTTGGISCDGSELGNETQTDILLGDISFYAEQARHNESFVCNPGDCIEKLTSWLNSVVDNNQGLRKNGTPVDANRSDPAQATGPAEDNGLVGTFYSLGFGGDVTLQFAGPVADGAGDDLLIHETTNGTYPLEKAEVFVSQDGLSFTSLGEVDNTGGGDKGVDINGAYPWIRYIKLVDTTNPAIHNDVADGYDLDGIEAIYDYTCSIQ